ncbi:alpha-ketoglutarate-dependent 2,4-dichlorophenoxyacetate dioxygenase [Stella humosa]|uniref:Alpha-ketoglutarate-dependent 2,4-dichlorophenoxyacetate dioxygenase n=1 Tax=Stella humosa TaxID=94 RepID=A0A3N1MBH3_9PROT|nr:TauD/TfdA family dioxygenase [Stella humosa]ROQ00047.1 alpha-ketoglutarate-dependent 2,4-dichlorophenoxyacetate dioxygenase [Stella humosa]BBK30720.1 alpha-ketoglutarate-dependent 2,4-dichlorophenoxyacetate dioxygenase [Stella humosa]
MEIRKLHPTFGVEVVGIDIGEPIDEPTFARIRAAFEEHGLLLLRDQHLDDDIQVAFSERFGPLETTFSQNPAGGTLFARQSNLDIKTGETIPLEDARMVYQRANMLWHTDSSFKRVPSLCSLLSARLVPPEGGNTDFADMRAAYDALPDETKTRIEGQIAWHSIAHSRAQVCPDLLTEHQKSVEAPPMKQQLVRANPVTGRKALFIGAHCSHIDGWPEDEGRAFIRQLMETAIKPEFCYSHQWREGDIVVWDNRALLHKATPFDGRKYKRLMQRTTVAGDGPTVAH